jgi:hypothetical protein
MVKRSVPLNQRPFNPGQGRASIRDVDAAAVAHKAEVGIAREERVELRPGEFDGGLLVLRDHFVQSSISSVCLLNYLRSRRLEPHVGGRR